MESDPDPNSTIKSLIIFWLNQIKISWEFIHGTLPGSIWHGPHGSRATKFSNAQGFNVQNDGIYELVILSL